MSALDRIAIGAIVLELPLQVDKYFLYDKDIARFGSIGGFHISVTTICLVVLYTRWMFAHRSAESTSPRLRVSGTLICYTAAVLLSLLVASNRLLSLFEVWLLTQALLLHIYMANRLRSRADVTWLLGCLMLAVIIQGCIMLVAYRVGHSFVIFGPVRARVDPETGRIAGTVGSVILAGSYFALLIPPTLALLLAPARISLKVVAVVALALAGTGLVLTQSRGAWLGCLVSCALVVALTFYRGWLPARVTLAACAGTAICAVVFHTVIIARLSGDDSGSARSRLPLNRIALQMISDSPILGVGSNNCATVALKYAGMPSFRGEWFYTVHNRYLLTWVETGVLGVVAFVGFLLETLRLAWQTWQRRNRFVSIISLGFGAAVLGQMIHMSVDVFNSRPQVQILWLVAGSVMALRWMENDS